MDEEIELTEWESGELQRIETYLKQLQGMIRDAARHLDSLNAELLRATGEKDMLLKIIKHRVKVEKGIDLDIAGNIALTDDYRKIIVRGVGK